MDAPRLVVDVAVVVPEAVVPFWVLLGVVSAGLAPNKPAADVLAGAVVPVAAAVEAGAAGVAGLAAPNRPPEAGAAEEAGAADDAGVAPNRPPDAGAGADVAGVAEAEEAAAPPPKRPLAGLLPEAALPNGLGAAVLAGAAALVVLV